MSIEHLLSNQEPEDEQRRRRRLRLMMVISIVGVLVVGLLIGVIVGRLLERRAAGPEPGTEEIAALATDAPATPTEAPGLEASGPVTEAVELMVESAAATAETPTAGAAVVWEDDSAQFGESVLGTPLVVHRYGTGPHQRAIVGGIHGGYEGNTVDLITRMMEALKSDPSLVSPDVTLYVISNINPDGYAAGTEPVESQVNANGIDLNSNWDYNWQEWITYGTEPVRAGRGGSFSEPETVALHDFIVDNGIELVLFYHSGHGVIVSGAEREQCATYELAEMLSSILEYPHDTEGTSGEIRSGLAIDYLSKVAVAAAEVDLPSTEPVDDEEFQRHLEALVAFMNWTIPTDLEGSADEATTGTYEWAGEAITHTVKAGETLWGIATDYDIAINSERYEELLRVNDIVDENALQIGMVLTIPPAEPEAEPEE